MSPIEMLRQKGIIPKAVLYARFSSDNQREESIEAQLRAQHEYCQRNGIVIVREYCDRAKSATTDNRPQFLQMVNDSKNEDFNIVLVHKLDRFARNRYDSAYYRRELKKNNVSLLSVLENLDDTAAKTAVRAASARPIPDDVRNSLAAFEDLKISDGEKSMIFEMTKNSYLARKRAIELLNVTEDELPPSIDTVLDDIEALEKVLHGSIGKPIDSYDARLIAHGDWVNKVQDEVTVFCDTYGE